MRGHNQLTKRLAHAKALLQGQHYQAARRAYTEILAAEACNKEALLSYAAAHILECTFSKSFPDAALEEAHTNLEVALQATGNPTLDADIYIYLGLTEQHQLQNLLNRKPAVPAKELSDRIQRIRTHLTEALRINPDYACYARPAESFLSRLESYIQANPRAN